MVLRGSLERLAPVLMTALTAGIGLVPLVLGGQEPGREILYPVATVILGGLVTSTFCEFLIHPGLFWRFSGKDAERLAAAEQSGDAGATLIRSLENKMRSFFLTCSLLTLHVTGCGPAMPTVEKKPVPAAATEHSHGAGPHGGTVIDWGGGKYHVEFTVDHGKQEATVYILGDDEKTPVPITAASLLLSIDKPAFQVELAATPLDADPSGAASRFVGQHGGLGKVQEFAGTVSGEVEGTPYAGDFTEQSHVPAAVRK